MARVCHCTPKARKPPFALPLPLLQLRHARSRRLHRHRGSPLYHLLRCWLGSPAVPPGCPTALCHTDVAGSRDCGQIERTEPPLQAQYCLPH